MDPQLESTLTEYLLGGLDPEERAHLEERVFMEDSLEDELQDVVDDLIASYLAGTLTAADRRRFETHFLASRGHRERLRFVKALRAGAPARRANAWWWALAAAALAGLLLWLLPLSRPAPRTESVVARPPAPRPTPSPGAVAPVAASAPEPKEVLLVRLPAAPASEAVVALSPAVATVRVEVLVDEQRPTVDAVLRDAGGNELWRREELAPPLAGSPVVLEVPARLLSGDSYTLTIEGEVVREVEGTPPPRVTVYRLRVERLQPPSP